MSERKLTHVAGAFLIQADGAFLNGAGLGEGEDRNVTIPKTFSDGKNKVPYVSAQAWKRWLRNTLIEETGWAASEVKAIGWNPKGNVNKIAAELNPVDFAEDDIFGYMRAEAGQGKATTAEDQEEEDVLAARTKSIMRASPFAASLLVALRKGWDKDEGFVHLTKFEPKALAEAELERFLSSVSEKQQDKKKSVYERSKEFGDDFVKKIRPLAEGGNLDELRKLLADTAGEKKKEVNFIENPCSPLPYTTRFFNTDLQAIFCLDYSRLGIYWNLGDRIELEPARVTILLNERKIADVTTQEPYKTLTDNGKIGSVYKWGDNFRPTRKERATGLLKALSVLRGGAKQAQFGTDVAPKVLILAGLTCGNPIFNNLFRDDQEGPVFKIETFKEILGDYGDRIATPVFLGIRSGYLKNESEVFELETKKNQEKVGDKGPQVEIHVVTPLEAAQEMSKLLP